MLKPKGTPKVGRGINDCESGGKSDFDVAINDYDREFEPINLEKNIRNHTADWLADWYWWEYVFYFVVEFAGTTLAALSMLVATNYFSGIGGTNVFIRAAIIGGSVIFSKFVMGRFTTLHLDPFRSFFTTLFYVLSRWRDLGTGRLWMEWFKLLVFIPAQWLGWLVALSFLGVTTDSLIKVDCATAPIGTAVCNVYPTLGAGVTVTAAAWQDGLGSMIIYGGLVFGEHYFGWMDQIPTLLSAISYGMAHFIVYAQWGASSGGSFNFFYWANVSWFSNITINDTIYIWPLIVGLAVLCILMLATYYAWKFTANRYQKISAHSD